jgi:hypothetical protein
MRYALSKNISRKGLRNRRSLRSGRDDKERVRFHKAWIPDRAFFITLGGPQAHDSSGEEHFPEGPRNCGFLV